MTPHSPSPLMPPRDRDAAPAARCAINVNASAPSLRRSAGQLRRCAAAVGGRPAAAIMVLLVLAGCAAAPTPDPETASADPITPAVRQRAVEQIITSTRSPDANVRANAIEAAHAMPDRLQPLLRLAIEDEHRVVRFAALVTIGRFQVRSLAPAAAHQLERERSAQTQLLERMQQRRLQLTDSQRHEIEAQISASRSVQAAAIFALHMCGQKTDLTPLAAMINSSDAWLKGNVAMLLGLMGDESAVPLLRAAARVPMARVKSQIIAIAEIQIAEAIVRLGDESAVDVVRAGAYSQFHEVRVLAVQAMGDLADYKMETALRHLLDDQNNNIELRLACAATLARMGRETGLPLAVNAASAPEPVFRAMAARVLTFFRDPRARAAVVSLLDDPSPRVRLVAANAVLRLADAD